MPGFSETLDVAIGLVFVFLLLSLLATWLQELITTVLKSRPKNLENIIQNLLDPPTNKLEGVEPSEAQYSEGVENEVARQLRQNVVKAFYDHPIIKGLAQPDDRPSYIAAREFGIVLFDLFTKAGTERPTQAEKTLESLENGINKLQNQSTKEALLAIIKTAEATEEKTEKHIAAVRQGIEAWYNAAMDRATGWYRREAQAWALVIGTVLAIVFNADSIGVARTLWRDSALRDTVSAAAVAYIQQRDEFNAKEAQQQLEELGLPIGWSRQNRPATLADWLWKVAGWILTGFAVSQGSPIWFDLLNRFVNMRGTGIKPKPAATGEG